MNTLIKILNPITKINCASRFKESITEYQKELLIDTMYNKTIWTLKN